MSDKAFGTFEWATHNVNIVNGCIHDCKYCYSKEMAIRFKRKTKDSWKNEELRKNYKKISIPKQSGIIMFPSSHDITPEFINEEKEIIDLLLKKEKNILIVSKPHENLIREICNEFKNYKKNIKFRFTIGSSDNKVLNFWEPNAPIFEERLKSLTFAYESGFRTSVSCEPILDDNTRALVEIIEPFVNDTIWIGKPNFLLRRLKMNGYDENSEEITKAKELLELLNDNYIKDLFNDYKNNNKIRWKESIKKIVGLDMADERGLDI